MPKRKLQPPLPAAALQALSTTSTSSASNASSSPSVVFTNGAAVALQACHDVFMAELAHRLSAESARTAATKGKKGRHYVQPHQVVQILTEEMALGDIAEQAQALLHSAKKDTTGDKKKRKLHPSADLEAEQERLLQASHAKMKQQQPPPP